MAPRQRGRKGTRPADHQRTSGRRASVPKRASGSHGADKYGHTRLGALYEISKLLSRFITTVEETVGGLLAILMKELPLRSVILIQKAEDRPDVIVWRSTDISKADLAPVQARALKTFNYLTGSHYASVDTLDTRMPSPAAPRTDVTSSRADRGNFLSCPLVIQGRPILGVLHLEGLAPFDEGDVEFVSAIANQLAVALDLYHARLHELALREQAESNRRRAEDEITSRRLVEEKVRTLNEGLERRVAERTSQFQDTIKELHAFTYSIAHDLRAPLRHIHGFSEFLLESGDPEACTRYAHRIMEATKSMDDLIRDLLAYSRLTLEEVVSAPVSLSSVLAEVRKSLEAAPEIRGFRLEINEPLPPVLAHESSLVQALSNLISNAVKFVAPGVQPRIRVRAEIRGNLVRLWVEDNGIGIAPEHHERIFGVFQRLHKVEDYPGTGIGLAIVRRALERMKGRVGVESKAGQGSRFWIELPKADGLG